jgi:hypothetical protein
MSRPVGVLLGVALVAAGCRTGPRENTARPGASGGALEDPHHHAVDVNGTWVTENPNEGFALVEVPELPAASERDESAPSPDGAFEAFATCEPECRVLVRSVSGGAVYALQGPLFSGPRPYSGLVWLPADVLVFDQWTQPHYGLHFAVDVKGHRLLRAAPFTDEAR